MLPWKCHSGNIMKLCADCSNCTKFQFYTEKVFRDIPFFVILYYFVSTMLRHKSSNLHNQNLEYRSYSVIRRTVFKKNLSFGGKLVLKLGCVL